MNAPKPLPGRNQFEVWCNALVAYIRSHTIKVGPGLRATRKPDGTYLETLAIGGGGRSTPGQNFSMLMYRVKTFTAANTITAVEWNGLVESPTSVTIAKLRDFQTSLTSEVVDGNTITHGFTDSNHRTSFDGLITQHEVLWPRYALNAVIIAAKCGNGTGISGADYFDITPRVWLAID